MAFGVAQVGGGEDEEALRGEEGEPPGDLRRVERHMRGREPGGGGSRRVLRGPRQTGSGSAPWAWSAGTASSRPTSCGSRGVPAAPCAAVRAPQARWCAWRCASCRACVNTEGACTHAYDAARRRGTCKRGRPACSWEASSIRIAWQRVPGAGSIVLPCQQVASSASEHALGAQQAGYRSGEAGVPAEQGARQRVRGREGTRQR